jgi:hypothetical protein
VGSGSGSVYAQELTATSASLAASGSGDIVALLAGGTLDLELSGSGDIDWYGTATISSSSRTGSGQITHH